MTNPRGRERDEHAHHLDETIIGAHRRVEIEDVIVRDDPECRPDMPLDLGVVELRRHKHRPPKRCAWHHLIQTAQPLHQRQYLPLVKCGNHPGPGDACVH